jgi:hypothetical protein
MTTTPIDPQHPYRDRIRVLLRGDLPGCARGWAIEEVEDAVTHEALPLVTAQVTLRHWARETGPCQASIAVDLCGHIVEGHAEAKQPRVALHLAAERVHRQARNLSRRVGSGGSGAIGLPWSA